MINYLQFINNISCITSSTNFIVIDLHEQSNPEFDIYNKLLTHNIPVRNYSHIMQMKNCIRLSVFDDETNKHSVSILEKLIA